MDGQSLPPGQDPNQLDSYPGVVKQLEPIQEEGLAFNRTPRLSAYYQENNLAPQATVPFVNLKYERDRRLRQVESWLYIFATLQIAFQRLEGVQDFCTALPHQQNRTRLIRVYLTQQKIVFNNHIRLSITQDIQIIFASFINGICTSLHPPSHCLSNFAYN
jgi:hypothetical protein